MDISISSQPDIEGKKPLGFLDLPGEIRNQIYELLFCDFALRHDSTGRPGPYDKPSTTPNQMAFVKQNIHLKILRTCREIYLEGTYLMRKKNLFVRFEIEIDSWKVSLALQKMQVPFISASQHSRTPFKGTVMTHEIRYRNSRRPLFGDIFSFVLLHRHLHHLCVALSAVRWKIGFQNESVEHVVTLTDPCETKSNWASFKWFSRTPKAIESFFSRKLQEELVAPYRAHLKGFPHFTFKGVIPRDLKTAATMDITLMPDLYNTNHINMFLDNMNDIKSQGEYFYNKGFFRAANGNWKECQEVIERTFFGETGEGLRQSGGTNFMNSIAKLHFELAFLYARGTSQLMQTKLRYESMQLARAAIELIYFSRDLELLTRQFGNLITWQPDPAARARYHHSEARCFQMAMYLPRARGSIDRR